jgi:hypothetical protein
MLQNSVSPAGGPRVSVVPPGRTDLNTLLSGLLSDCAATHIRCDTLPYVAGAQEEWWLLLRWLLQPLRQAPAGPRYVHIQCCEDSDSREQRYLLTLRCNGFTEIVRAFAFGNPQLAGIAGRLGVTLRQPSAADAHCLFILEFPGKKLIHAHQ